MEKLTKYTVDYNEKRDKWELTKDASNKVVRSFDTKADFTAGGVLRKAVGSEGGSVKIQKTNGRFQEERTYPRGRDPKGSRG